MAKRDKEAMTVMTATRLIALWNVSRAPEKQDPEYQLREMSRWYAREFNYKLHEVDDVPMETIAMHYWEHQYQQFTPEEREEELRMLTSTEEELAESKKLDDDFLAKTVAEAKSAAEKGKELASQLKKLAGDKQHEMISNVDKLKTEMNQPSINMTFVDAKELENMEDFDILGDTSPKKK